MVLVILFAFRFCLLCFGLAIIKSKLLQILIFEFNGSALTNHILTVLAQDVAVEGLDVQLVVGQAHAGVVCADSQGLLRVLLFG